MGETSTSQGLRCEVCSTPPPVRSEQSPALLFTAFPWMLGNCVMHLASGPSTVPCKNCRTVTKLPLAQIVVGPDGVGVLYLPDDRIGPDPTIETAVMESLLNLPSGIPVPLEIVRSEREFRRAFIKFFIEPAGTILNDWVRDDGPPLKWAKRHLDQVDARFFGAVYLLSMGLLPLFVAPTGYTGSSYVPHGAAPPEASNVVRQHESQQQIAQNGGNILGVILIHWVMETFTARSFSPFLNAVDKLLPPGMGLGTMANAAANQIEQFLSNVRLGEPGATLMHYIAEGLLALLLRSRNTDNPRLKEWTHILVRYEFERRLDGNGEELLLEPDLLKPTLDSPLYWQAVRAYGRMVGQEGDDRERMEKTIMLIKSVARLFPEEANRLLQIELRTGGDVPDPEVLTSTKRLLAQAASDLPAQNLLLRSALMGLARQRGHLLESAVEATIDSSAGQAASAARLCRIASHAIEALHVAEQFSSAARLAKVALAKIDEAKEQGFTTEEELPLLNEIGNTRRYGANYRGALEVYDHILAVTGNDASKRDVRVVMRNRAIVLRELNRFQEALQVFRALRQVSQDSEKMSLVVSESACLGAMGDATGAARLVGEHASLLNAKSLSEREAREFIIALAQSRLYEEEFEEAAKLAEVLERYLTSHSDGIVQFIATRIRLRLAVRSGSLDSATAGAAAMALRKAANVAEQMPGLPDALLGATEDLDLALRNAGQPDAAEQQLRDLIKTGISMETPRGWLLHVWSLQHAIRRRDLTVIGSDVIDGMRALGNSLDRLASESDALAFLAPHQDSLDALVAQALRFVEYGPVDAGRLARIAGDLRAAPVLTARLRNRVGLRATIADTEDEARRLAALLPPGTVAAVQAIEAEGEVALLLTRTSAGGNIITEVRRLPVSIGDAAKIAGGLPMRLRRVRADARSIDIERLDRWQAVAAALREALSDLPPRQTLAISPGPIGSLAFSLALGPERPICFVPSVGALMAMRAARLALPDGRSWRPTSMLDFSVWFADERAEEAASLAGAPDRGAEIAARHRLRHRALAGTEGNADNLLLALQDVDVARIACHGRLLANDEAVDLIVAAGGLLPPANFSELLAVGRATHVLSWRRISALPRAPLVVFSSACDSGATILHEGGERLGLERAFFAAGTIAYVAPQWPVPTIAIQRLVDNVVAQWLLDPSKPLVQLVTEERIAARDRGEPALAVEAFAVFGDGL